MIFILSAFIVVATCAYIRLFYPQQIINPQDIKTIVVDTPKDDPDYDYHNDCLHPCIRKAEDGSFLLVQSPWYNYDDSIENPILYKSKELKHINNGIVVEKTPACGYNSDPCVFEEKGLIWVFWREVDTPLCKQLCVRSAVVAVYTKDMHNFSKKKVYITNNTQVSKSICPIVIRKDKKYRIYTTWYDTSVIRHNIGITIWEGTSLSSPDFIEYKSIKINPPYICDKYKQIRIFHHLFFIPKPHKFDLWHFDLAEHNGVLYIAASEEMGDSIIFGKSPDWEKFSFIKTPLVNAHYMENYVNYRQRYYKPSFIFDGDNVVLLYTTNSRDIPGYNILQGVYINFSENKHSS